MTKRVMSNIIAIIVAIIDFFFNRKSPSPDDRRKQLDIELADAIKRGDAEAIARIRDEIKNYPNL